jgi:hypothetical protein
VFYDLHSTVLRPEESGSVRLRTIVAQFRPDMVLVSVDPHEGAPAGKPLIDWLRRETSCFEEVFSDAAVSAFRVSSGCAARVQRSVPPGVIARMTA